MNVIGKSSPQEAILEWLKAELYSARFSSELKQALHEAGKDESIITNADLANDKENRIRLSILKSYRKWVNIDFDGFDWQYVELSQPDVHGLRYINYSYWNELSDNTRLVIRAVANIKRGKSVFDKTHDGFYSVAHDVEAGKSLPPIILITNENDHPEILEGHLRATGYALARNTKQPLLAILGTLSN